MTQSTPNPLKDLSDHYAEKWSQGESAPAGGIADIIDSLPPNRPLYKDSGLWTIYDDFTDREIIRQGVTESFTEFILRYFNQFQNDEIVMTEFALKTIPATPSHSAPVSEATELGKIMCDKLLPMKQPPEYYQSNFGRGMAEAKREGFMLGFQEGFAAASNGWVDWDQLKKEAESWIPKELSGDQHIKAVTIIESFFNEQREKYHITRE
jgi:hypothetical protein